MRTGWGVVGGLHAHVILICCSYSLILVLRFLLVKHLLTYLTTSALFHLVDLLVDGPSITLLVQGTFRRKSHSSWVIVSKRGLRRLQISSIRHQLTLLVAWWSSAHWVSRTLCLIASLTVIWGRRIRLFKHWIIDAFRHSSCKYLHLLCMGVGTLKNTNSTVSQSLVLVAPKACILLRFLFLVNYHYTVLLNTAIALFIGFSKRIV